MAETQARTVDHLLDAAEAEFAARGFSDARLEDIAATCGIRRASLLYHFPNKQALYDRVLARAFSTLTAKIVGALAKPAASYEERLREVVARSADDLSKRPLFARLMMRELLEGGDVAVERARAHVVPLIDLAESFLRAGRASGAFSHDGHPRALVMVVLGAIVAHASESPAVREVLWGELPPTKTARAHRDALVSMVAAAMLVPMNEHVRPAPRARHKEARR